MAGNLVLDGTLNVSDAGGFGIGVYQLFSYGGSLTDNGLQYGALPGSLLLGQLSLQTSVANQINLVVGDTGQLQFWNGSKTNPDGTISGGDGTWGPDTNWTNASGSASNGWGSQYAIFGGASGTVSVLGQQSFGGIQFVSDGYQLVAGSGGALAPVNAADGSLATVRVNSGATATISAPLVGTGGIQKTDLGTLVLQGANTYSGGTTISGGTLVGDTTSLQGNIVDNASLVFQQGNDGQFNGTLSGTGNVSKQGAGDLLLVGNQPFSGAFAVDQGVAGIAGVAAQTVHLQGTAQVGGAADVEVVGQGRASR